MSSTVSRSGSLLPGLQIFEEAISAYLGDGGESISFEPGREQSGFTIIRESDGWKVKFARPCDAYRALGLLLASDTPPENLSQDCAHESVGVMWDLSRNAVLRVEAWEVLLQKFALLGINTVQLYMEDVYQIPGEPFFGYARGAYSAEELRQIDEYGVRLGIEIIPCIQTLGHMEQVLHWPSYHDYSDVPGVLMVGEERTYRLIGKMLDRVASCFRSRTVHIGMDEAHGLGTGNYLRKNGFRQPFDIFTEHLLRVVELCRQRGLRPMIWSDMFFRIGSPANDYYDREANIPETVVSRVPHDVDLVYWDYYHADSAFYEEWIQRHRDMGKEPIIASGAWTWGRFWAYAPSWRETIAAGMKAARAQKLAKALLTIWGDDGAEFHPSSALPAVQYFAEWAYAGEPDENALERQFAIISPGSSLGRYLQASKIDQNPTAGEKSTFPANYSRWILWHDPVLGFHNAQITADFPEHFRNLASILDRTEAEDSTIRFAGKVAKAVALKAELHLNARPAWDARDMAEIKRLGTGVLPECVRAVHELWHAHHAVWMEWNKPFGWEVIEYRYAGICARLERLRELLANCESGAAGTPHEWGFDLSPTHMSPEGCYFNYGQVNTASASK